MPQIFFDPFGKLQRVREISEGAVDILARAKQAELNLEQQRLQTKGIELLQAALAPRPVKKQYFEYEAGQFIPREDIELESPDFFDPEVQKVFAAVAPLVPPDYLGLLRDVALAKTRKREIETYPLSPGQVRRDAKGRIMAFGLPLEQEGMFDKIFGRGATLNDAIAVVATGDELRKAAKTPEEKTKIDQKIRTAQGVIDLAAQIAGARAGLVAAGGGEARAKLEEMKEYKQLKTKYDALLAQIKQKHGVDQLSVDDVYVRDERGNLRVSRKFTMMHPEKGLILDPLIEEFLTIQETLRAMERGESVAVPEPQGQEEFFE